MQAFFTPKSVFSAGSRVGQWSPPAMENLGKTDAYARTAGPIASHQVFRSFAPRCRCAIRRWLEHDEAADAAFEAVHSTPTVPTNSQEHFNNGLGPDSLHHLQSARVWHRYVLCHQVALRPREEGERRGQQVANVGRTYARHDGLGGLISSVGLSASGLQLIAPCHGGPLPTGTDQCPQNSLDCVRRAQRFSWWMTTMHTPYSTCWRIFSLWRRGWDCWQRTM